MSAAQGLRVVLAFQIHTPLATAGAPSKEHGWQMVGNGVGLCNTVVCRESRRAFCLVLVDPSVIKGTASPWQLGDNTEQNLAPRYHHVQWHCVSVDSLILKVSFTRAWPLRLEHSRAHG
ncbi:unnamed protein product [Rangifer tarandus platyrhynchus]|uniref:Secreted protein n=2 Tax=Rangifer tarandus platyrhynchus TaxID=3082113 RepID=A0ABN8YDW2_RANTA|nr:unnamed protein product [Rangifer tarandus platyrhynchus]